MLSALGRVHAARVAVRLAGVRGSGGAAHVRVVATFSVSPHTLAPRVRLFASSAVVADEASDTAPVTRSIDEFGLSPSLCAALRRANFDTLFPVQATTLPLALEGKDLVVRAKTGTGKTLGFVIPVVESLLRRNVLGNTASNGPSCLVLTPTRELAMQVEAEFKKVIGPLRLKSVSVYGGVPYARQIDALSSGVDIVVGTPGRIMDLLEKGVLNLSNVCFATLDEADDMLRVGFQEDVTKIYTHFSSEPGKVQHMLWSATIPTWIKQLTKEFMNAPKFVDLIGTTSSRLPTTLTNVAIPTTRRMLHLCLPGIISEFARVDSKLGLTPRTLIFTDTKLEATEVVSSVPRDSRVGKLAALTGDFSQSVREATLRSFRSGEVSCLVATDVAARGLDIPEVDLVIHCGPPQQLDTFQHRSGRTGRAGRSGTNVVLFDPKVDGWRSIMRLSDELGFKFAVRSAPVRSLTEADLERMVSTVLASSNLPVLPGSEQRVAKVVDTLVEKLTAEGALRAAVSVLLQTGNPTEVFSALTGMLKRHAMRVPVESRGAAMTKMLSEVSRLTSQPTSSLKTVVSDGYLYFDAPLATATAVMAQLKAEMVTELPEDVVLSLVRPRSSGGFDDDGGGGDGGAWSRDGRHRARSVGKSRGGGHGGGGHGGHGGGGGPGHFLGGYSQPSDRGDSSRFRERRGERGGGSSYGGGGGGRGGSGGRGGRGGSGGYGGGRRGDVSDGGDEWVDTPSRSRGAGSWQSDSSAPRSKPRKFF